MFKLFTIVPALAGACMIALATIPSAMAMPILKLGLAPVSSEATQIRYGHHGFHGGRHFGRHHFGGLHHRHHYGYLPRYSYGLGRHYYSYGFYYRPYYYPYRHYGYGGYGRGYGW